MPRQGGSLSGIRGSDGAQVAAACTKTPGAGRSRKSSAGRGSPCAQAMAQATRTIPARNVTRSFSPDGLGEGERPHHFRMPRLWRPFRSSRAGGEYLRERLEQLRPVLLQLALPDALHPPELREVPGLAATISRRVASWKIHEGGKPCPSAHL